MVCQPPSSSKSLPEKPLDAPLACLQAPSFNMPSALCPMYSCLRHVTPQALLRVMRYPSNHTHFKQMRIAVVGETMLYHGYQSYILILPAIHLMTLIYHRLYACLYYSKYHDIPQYIPIWLSIPGFPPTFPCYTPVTP